VEPVSVCDGGKLSNQQIVQELDLNKTDVYQMTCRLRVGIVIYKPQVHLGGVVECDEVYVVAGHKAASEAVKQGRTGQRP
jgi:transposase